MDLSSPHVSPIRSWSQNPLIAPERALLLIATMAKVLDEMPKEVAMAPGQASKDEQEMFNDPTGKYKLVMKGALSCAAMCIWNTLDCSCIEEYGGINAGRSGPAVLQCGERAGAYGAIEAAILPGDSLKAETGSMVCLLHSPGSGM